MTANRDSLVVVVSPTSAGNALGRAMCLYWIAASVSPAILISLDDGPLWQGVDDLSTDVIKVGSQSAFRDAIFREAGQAQRLVIWHSKPIGRTLSWSIRLANEHLADLVVDIDDDDAGFGDIFRGERFRNRIQLHPARSISPERIRRTLTNLRRNRSFTASSLALVQHLNLPRQTTVVPHARPSSPRLNSPADLSFPRFGFFGTPRTFKGMAELSRFARAAGKQAEIHLFEDPIAVREFASLENVVWHKPVTLTQLRLVYEHINILMLPQRQQPAARFQLPAKLCDALQFRRVVLATPTPPVAEVAGDAFETVEDWGDSQAIWQAVRRAADRHGDHTQRVDRAFANITIEQVAANIGGVLGL